MPGLSVIWTAAGLVLATDAGSVVEVLPPLAWQHAPGVPECVRGFMLHRGRLIPLLDATRLLGAPAQPDRMCNRVLVLRVAADGRSPEWHVGLWVQNVLDLDRIDFAAPGGHPGLASEAVRFLGPIAHTRWGSVQLVRPADLFTPEQIDLLTRRLAEAAA